MPRSRDGIEKAIIASQPTRAEIETATVEGTAAFQAGQKPAGNPYRRSSKTWAAWRHAWNMADMRLREARRKK